jgi:pre-mRNA-processing factor 19
MKTRRKRPLPEDWATGDDISSYTPQATSRPFRPGDKVFSVNESGDLALVGGVDDVVDIYSVPENKVQQSLKADGGSITDALWVGDRVAISTAKGKVLVFSPFSDAEPGSFEAHAGSATAVAAHASGELLASVGEDSTYVIYDLQTMSILTQVQTESST